MEEKIHSYWKAVTYGKWLTVVIHTQDILEVSTSNVKTVLHKYPHGINLPNIIIIQGE
jgi:hypothetical protein